MARNWYIHGEALVQVKSGVDSVIASLSELGLTQAPIVITPDVRHSEITLDAWGGVVPAEIQVMLGAVTISMTFIHFDPAILEECWRLSMGGPGEIGETARAGTLLGGGTITRFAAGYKFVGLNITSPASTRPWRFLHSYMTGSFTWPIGTEKSVVSATFRAIPYAYNDPYQQGDGADDQPIWDRTLDT